MEEFTVGHDMLELLNSMDIEELREFAVLQEDSISNTSMELLVCIRYLIYQKEPSTENLDQAVRQGEAWMISTAPSDADLAKKFKIVGKILHARLQFCTSREVKEDTSHLYVLDTFTHCIR